MLIPSRKIKRFAFIYKYTYTGIPIHMYLHTYVYTRRHRYVCYVCICVCAYVCVHIYMHMQHMYIHIIAICICKCFRNHESSQGFCHPPFLVSMSLLPFEISDSQHKHICLFVQIFNISNSFRIVSLISLQITKNFY